MSRSPRLRSDRVPDAVPSPPPETPLPDHPRVAAIEPPAEPSRSSRLQDPLTGLPNREALRRTLRGLLAPPSPALGALLYLDLDRFKLVNDSLGHDRGDDLLVQVAQRRRFGRGEVSRRLHYWPTLWGNAYGHLYGALSPDALTGPRRSLGGALYAVVGDWELAGHFEWRRYAGTPIYRMGPQVAWYVGAWYLRLRTSITEQAGTWSVTQSAAARYYLGSADSFVEGRAGYGRTVEVVGLRPDGGLPPDRPLGRAARPMVTPARPARAAYRASSLRGATSSPAASGSGTDASSSGASGAQSTTSAWGRGCSTSTGRGSKHWRQRGS